MDAAIAVASLAALALIIVAIDRRAGDQMARFVATHVVGSGGAAIQLHNGVTHLTRSAWELSYVYGPLMTFTGIALVLVFFMVRTK